MENYLKLVLSNWNKAIYILYLHILLLAEADLILKKRYSNKNLVEIFSFGDSKVIFILLIEVVIFHIRFTTIQVQELCFRGLS